MMFGANQGTMTGLRRIIAGAMSRDLCGFVVPGSDVAHAHGLDFSAAGLHLSTTPRHANVLVVVGPLPAGLLDAATVAYAQMPRPRAILALGTDTIDPLPTADATGSLNQQELVDTLSQLRNIFATSAFAADVSDFDAPALQTRIEYTCPMHSEIISDEPGNCPICGMDLMPKETTAGDHSGHTNSGQAHSDHAPTHQPKTAAHDHTSHDHTTHSDSTAQYICPMHPEVTSNEPGSCPKCGMFLVPVADEPKDHSGHDHGTHAAETQTQYTCPMHPEIISDEPGQCPKCGMNLVPQEAVADEHGGHAHAAHDHTSHDHTTHSDTTAQYICPMHPEVTSNEPGSCPKCGMFLVPVADEPKDHSGHDHGTHARAEAAPEDHSGHSGHSGGPAIAGIEPQFMSMVSLTRDMPASPDGLKMEWIDLPFGPFFPGLPSGLALTLTLDGDAVARTQVSSAAYTPLNANGMTATDFIDHFANLSPLSPVANRQLACMAIENAAGITVNTETAATRVAEIERERIASHLGWLANLSIQTGLIWMEHRIVAWQLFMQTASQDQIGAKAEPLRKFLHRFLKTPLLRSKLANNGHIAQGQSLLGPVARAQGMASDARIDDEVYQSLGFKVLTHDGGDALARLHQRCGEIVQSLDLIARASGFSSAQIHSLDGASGTGGAVLETPRGAAHLSVEIDAGTLISATYHPPCANHIKLLDDMVQNLEVSDALVAIGSLDLSPWGLST